MCILFTFIRVRTSGNYYVTVLQVKRGQTGVKKKKKKKSRGIVFVHTTVRAEKTYIKL